MYFIRSLYFFPAISENFSIFLFILEISIFLSLNTQPIGGDNMNSKTILSLYNGDYSCIERPIPKDSKYAKALSKCTDLQEKLAQLVDKETFSLIEKVLEYQSELSAIEMEEVFTEGFSLAVSLLLEAISKE